MATLWDYASGRTDARNTGAATDKRTTGTGDIPWLDWEMNKGPQAILKQRAADQSAYNATAPQGYGSFSWNQPLTDADKQWYYNMQSSGPWNGMMWSNTDDWRNIVNSVGNSDLLAGATQMARNGGLSSYHSAFSDSLRDYLGKTPLDSYGTYSDATKGWLGNEMAKFGITPQSSSGIPVGSTAITPTTPTTPTTPVSTETAISSASTPETATIPNFGDPITDPSSYLNPYVDWSNKQAMDKIQQSAAARGNLNSGATIKALSDYLTGSNQQNWNNAETTALADAARRYGVYNNDRNFDYNAQVGDRAFNQQNNQFLANLGLSGTQGQSQLQQLLATLLSNNTIAAGQAQGAGTVGSSNALQNSLQQVIAQMLMGQYYPKG